MARMKLDPPTLFEKIARDELGITTLETQNSDGLDFHDVSVWGVRNALQAAFNAGRAHEMELATQAALKRK